ncbi:MAG: alanine dehydrogenase [Candidatus Omnitrophica bacterium]|nr:alanine dehydrogenase [Candidatus Omnitrophota bacterium]MCM8828351.1 alanine dehydrogenase [Candidatus Omnitrophota bacterium]
MLIGVLKEIKIEEYRVGLTPASVKVLASDGHQVMVEKNAGAGSGFPDDLYLRAGASIVSKNEIFDSAEMIIKVKEPQMSEIELMRDGQILFTFFHFASNPAMTEALVGKKLTCIAYELIEENGIRPILKPMSEIAGKLSVQQGMKYLEKPYGGKGVLLTGATGVEPGKVVIFGGGVAGSSAAQVSNDLGAKISIIEKNKDRMQELKNKFPRAEILESTRENIINSYKNADIIIGSVLVPGHRPPVLMKRDDLKSLEEGTVIVDISIDEGGVFESSHPTTHKDPIYIDSGIVHYCVPNMPGIVPRTATIALNAASISYAKEIAFYGENVVDRSVAIGKGCAILRGNPINPAIQEILEEKN